MADQQQGTRKRHFEEDNELQPISKRINLIQIADDNRSTSSNCSSDTTFPEVNHHYLYINCFLKQVHEERLLRKIDKLNGDFYRTIWLVAIDDHMDERMDSDTLSIVSTDDSFAESFSSTNHGSSTPFEESDSEDPSEVDSTEEEDDHHDHHNHDHRAARSARLAHRIEHIRRGVLTPPPHFTIRSYAISRPVNEAATINVSSDEEQNEDVRRERRAIGVEYMRKRKEEQQENNSTRKRSRASTDNEGDEDEAAKHDSEEGDGAAICSVCFDEIDGGGDHRLVALKCGHPFGESCVKRWLQSEKRTCPMCNCPASLKDLRVVFLDNYKLGSSYELSESRKKITMMDKEIETSTKKISQLETELEALRGENSILRDRVKTLETNYRPTPLYSSSSSKTGDFPSVEYFSRLSGHCKYMAYSKSLDMIAVSTRSLSGPFNGHGVHLCSLYDLNKRNTKLLHREDIKDLQFHATRQWLLTASMDCRVRISNADNMGLTSVHSLTLPSKVWSCCWSQRRDTNFYVGLNNGKIHEYDVRQPVQPVTVLTGPSNRFPIVSLRSYSTATMNTGIICSDLRQTVRLYNESAEGTYDPKDIPVSGRCFSLSYYENKSSLLISSRASSGVMNELVSLRFRDSSPDISVQCKFSSGGDAFILERPTLCSSPDGDLWACCLDDSKRSIQVFSCGTTKCELSLKSQDPDGTIFTQVERVTTPGRSNFSIIGVSKNGLSVFS